MTTPELLQALLQISGFSQTDLAETLGVSFVTLNRWLHGKAIPRKEASKRIDALFMEYTGQKRIPEDALVVKKILVSIEGNTIKNPLQIIVDHVDIRDQLVLVLTYTSNSIEGSTLTEAETAVVLFHNGTLPDKTLIEQLEAKNHQTALMYLFRHLSEKKPIDEALILRLHAILMNGIMADAGFYRRHGVRIVGADLPTANHLKVPALMEELIADLRHQHTDIVAHTASIHARFEQIHPFSDGNGRIGRLLMHAMFLQEHLPPAVIRPEQKRLYYSSLNTAQKKKDTSLLQDFLCDAVLEGWEFLRQE